MAYENSTNDRTSKQGFWNTPNNAGSAALEASTAIGEASSVNNFTVLDAMASLEQQIAALDNASQRLNNYTYKYQSGLCHGYAASEVEKEKVLVSPFVEQFVNLGNRLIATLQVVEKESILDASLLTAYKVDVEDAVSHNDTDVVDDAVQDYVDFKQISPRMSLVEMSDLLVGSISRVEFAIRKNLAQLIDLKVLREPATGIVYEGNSPISKNVVAVLNSVNKLINSIDTLIPALDTEDMSEVMTDNVSDLSHSRSYSNKFVDAAR